MLLFEIIISRISEKYNKHESKIIKKYLPLLPVKKKDKVIKVTGSKRGTK
jgi:hypothetical protein